MRIKNKPELKHERVKQQFGCGYYSVCCRDECPCSFKLEEYDPEKMNLLKKEFEQKTQELFG